MKIENSRAAVRRYIIRRSPIDHFATPDVPDECGPVHAVLLESPRMWVQRKLDRLKRQINRQRGIQFIEYEWNAPSAMCGQQVRVVYPMVFDTEEEEACGECKSLATIRAVDPEEYLRQAQKIEERRRERQRRWMMREREREERERFIEDLDAFNERQARSLGDIPEDVDLDNPDTWVFPNLGYDADPKAGESA